MVPDTLPPSSRRFTQPGSPETFGALSNFLREAIADEDTRLFSESMGELADRAEAVVLALQASRKRAQVAPVLMDMMTVLREHRALVLRLALSWRGMYEYAGYLQSLNSFRVLIGEWLLHTAPWDDEVGVTAEDFRSVAWRTMGDGLMLLEMYEDWLSRGAADSEPALREPQRERVRQWWHRLRR